MPYMNKRSSLFVWNIGLDDFLNNIDSLCES